MLIYDNAPLNIIFLIKPNVLTMMIIYLGKKDVQDV